MEDLLRGFTPDNVVSVAFLLVLIGVGRWFRTQFWPWYAGHKNQEIETIGKLVDGLSELTTDVRELVAVSRHANEETEQPD